MHQSCQAMSRCSRECLDLNCACRSGVTFWSSLLVYHNSQYAATLDVHTGPRFQLSWGADKGFCPIMIPSKYLKFSHYEDFKSVLVIQKFLNTRRVTYFWKLEPVSSNNFKNSAWGEKLSFFKLQLGSMFAETRVRWHYKISKKIRLVEWIEKIICPVREASRQFGVSPKTIREWKQKFKDFQYSYLSTWFQVPAKIDGSMS